ncbi:MAG: Gfo/Idh/MocA family oxidoreductase [Actinobacteria bacterium]|nr:Gfo/Idh/MocA family oxidoreductase [Actinomycetota bacterium]
MKRVKAGIIGMGFVGPIHLEALRRLGFVDIAIAESNYDRAKAAATKYGISEFYGNWNDLLNDSKIEVIHICAPNNLHYPIAKRAIELGKHVICDKPLTLNIKECEDLVNLAESKGIINVVTFNMLFYPLIIQAKTIVGKGEIGKINYLQGYYFQDWLLYDTDYNWRVEASAGGNSRIIGDLGVHCISMIQDIIQQKVSEVYADFNTFLPTRKKPIGEIKTYEKLKDDTQYEDIKIDTEDQATLLMKFDGGAKGVFIGCQCCAGRKTKIGWEIYGSKKSLAWNGEEPNTLWIGNRFQDNQVLMKDFTLLDDPAASFCDFVGGLQEGYAETWKNLMKTVYSAILKGKHVENLYPTFKDGLYIQKIVDASVESSRSGKWISI